MLVLILVSACDRSPPGFVLPEGDAENGQKLFVAYECTACHTVRNLELPEPQAKGPVDVSLGGRVAALKSYSELVTSVINPSHKFVRGRRKEEVSQEGESLMTVYNDVMTVSELIDLVAFLESQYELMERPGYRYPVYTY